MGFEQNPGLKRGQAAFSSATGNGREERCCLGLKDTWGLNSGEGDRKQYLWGSKQSVECERSVLLLFWGSTEQNLQKIREKEKMVAVQLLNIGEVPAILCS